MKEVPIWEKSNLSLEEAAAYSGIGRERGGKYYVEKTKTECGCRYIPMTEEVYQSLNNILARRKKVKTEIIVDGYSSFLLLDKDDKPKVALHIENEMRWAMKKYVLYQHGKCRYGYQEPAICNGAF